MREEKILEDIFKKHKRKIRYVNFSNKKLIVCFSGIPGSGKTYISKLIEKKFKGVRISTDEIRKIIKKLGSENKRLLDRDCKEKILHEYLYNFIEKYPFENKLLILDKGIDRDYKKIFCLARKKKFKIFVIRVKSSIKEIERRLIKCKGKLDDNYVKSIKRWEKEFKDFGKKIKPDLAINNDYKLNVNKIYRELDKII